MGFYARVCRSSGYLVVRGHKVSWESADSSRLWVVGRVRVLYMWVCGLGEFNHSLFL